MEQHLQDVVDYHKDNVINLYEHMVDKDTYADYVESVYDSIKLGFEIKEYREQIVTFRFRPDSELIQLQFRHYLTNLMLWHAFVRLDATDKLDRSCLLDMGQISKKHLKSYFDNKIIIPCRSKVTNMEMNKIVAYTLHELTRISTDFNIILGMSMNIEGFIDLSKTNKRFDEIIRTKLDDELQPIEIESLIGSLLKEEIQILADSDTLFAPMIRSGTGVNPKQLAELTISGGLKPDLHDQTVPIPINTNLIVGGLNSVSSYYIDALGGRKAMILNVTEMGRSGHFARKMMLLGSISDLDRSGEACNSISPISITIKNEKYLKLFDGRYYKLPHWRKYKVLDINDKSLIGQTIYIKSPCTCSSEHGICRECYGETLYHINKDVHVGLLAGATTTNPISQKILSSKHILATKSKLIKFCDDFYKFFSLRGNEIYTCPVLENPKNYEIVIIQDNVVKTEALSDGDITDFVPLFHVKNLKTGEMHEIHAEKMQDIYIDPDFVKMIGINGKRATARSINMMDIDDEQRIGVMEIFNNPLTKPLYDMINLLNSSTKRKSMNIITIDDLVQKMADLIIESGIDTVSIHPEVLMSQLIRDKNNIMERPKFNTFKGLREYVIETLDSSLSKHKSPIIGMSFQYLKRQLTDPMTFKKDGSSILDPLFKVKG